MAGKKGMKGGMKGSRRPLNKQQQMMMMQNGQGPVWDKIKSVAGKVNQFLKDTKVLSTVAGLVPPSTPYVGAIAQPASIALKSLGYGKKQMGRGVISTPNGVISTYEADKPLVKSSPVGINQVQSGYGKRKALKF